jgi:acetylglutamate kinase
MKKQNLTIVKIGGKIVSDENKLDEFLKKFAQLPGLKILVHGGGRLASEILLKMGITPQMVNGRRITNAPTLKVIQMVYGGLINTTVVAKLQALNCNAAGMTGADGNSIVAQKRPVKDIDFGFVGDVIKVNPQLLLSVLEQAVPVFCALTHDHKGQMYNTNADSVTAELAKELAKTFTVDLVFCFELRGLLRNPKDESSLIPEINERSYQELKNNKIITDGMIPKMDNAFDALRNGVHNVYITRYDAVDPQAENSGSRIFL